MHFSNKHFAAMGAALLLLMASGLGVIYKTQGEFQLRAEQAAQASARTQAAQQAGQRLARMALDLRGLLAAGALPEVALARHRDSLQWQHAKVEAALQEMVKAVAPAQASAVEQALASLGLLQRLYKQALAGPRPGGAAAPDAGLLAVEAEAQQRLEDLQGVLARAAALDHARMLDGGGQTAQVAAVALLGGVAALALALFFGWWTARHVERAKQAIQRQQRQADSTSAGLLVEMQTHLADSQQALRVSLQAAKELSEHAERLVTNARCVPAPKALPGTTATAIAPLTPLAPFSRGASLAAPAGAQAIPPALSPQALSAQVIERARRASR